jgi:rubrerythrin
VDSPSSKPARLRQGAGVHAPRLIISAPIKKVESALSKSPAETGSNEDAMRCERCGADMYRMHAVWRCPNCRFKTDCCGTW